MKATGSLACARGDCARPCWLSVLSRPERSDYPRLGARRPDDLPSGSLPLPSPHDESELKGALQWLDAAI
jgi:hypothetical protein